MFIDSKAFINYFRTVFNYFLLFLFHNFSDCPSTFFYNIQFIEKTVCFMYKTYACFTVQMFIIHGCPAENTLCSCLVGQFWIASIRVNTTANRLDDAMLVVMSYLGNVNQLYFIHKITCSAGFTETVTAAVCQQNRNYFQDNLSLTRNQHCSHSFLI